MKSKELKLSEDTDTWEWDRIHGWHNENTKEVQVLCFANDELGIFLIYKMKELGELLSKASLSCNVPFLWVYCHEECATVCSTHPLGFFFFKNGCEIHFLKIHFLKHHRFYKFIKKTNNCKQAEGKIVTKDKA